MESAFFSFYESMHIFIHSYPGAILGFLFVTGLAEKRFWCKHSKTFVSNLLNLDILILVL
ncbi:hypothetical protein EXW58_26400 (plasmid) [Bacillus mycoides]|nr:hypothetical protein EXW58_26400 [Bacillus mycoides]